MKTVKHLNRQLRALIYHEGIDSEMTQKEAMESLQREITKSCVGYLVAGIFIGVVICQLILSYEQN